MNIETESDLELAIAEMESKHRQEGRVIIDEFNLALERVKPSNIVKNILTDEFALKHGKPDILITDPPRAGMHEKVVRMLNTLAAPKLIYVSLKCKK